MRVAPWQLKWGNKTYEREIMAIRTVLVDDMDGGDADVTIAFIVNGESYTLDLSTKNAERFNKAIEPFVEAAQKRAASRVNLVEAEMAGVEQRAAIREWARKKGMEVSDRGRIPQDIVDAFNKNQRK